MKKVGKSIGGSLADIESWYKVMRINGIRIAMPHCLPQYRYPAPQKKKFRTAATAGDFRSLRWHFGQMTAVSLISSEQNGHFMVRTFQKNGCNSHYPGIRNAVHGYVGSHFSFHSPGNRPSSDTPNKTPAPIQAAILPTSLIVPEFLIANRCAFRHRGSTCLS